MTKKKKSILIAVIAAAAALAVIYFAVSVYYQERYLPGTVINSVSCSGMTTAEAEAALIDESDTYVLTLVEREGGSEEIAGSDISLEVTFSDEMDQILEQQNEYTWPAGLFYEESVQVESLVVYDENELDEVLESLSCMDEKNMTDPENAALSEYTEESGYELVAATEGTRLDEDVFKAAVAAAVAGLQSELDLAASGCYEEAEYNEESEKALNMLEAANRYVSTTITYEFGSSAEVVDGSLISQWILVDDDMNVTLDEEKLTEYVAELADTYNTAGQSKTLKTSYGTTVTVPGGNYGWKIDQESTLAALSEYLENGEDYTGDVVYSQTAASHGDTDYGDTYVEINLTAQHLWFYKDGALVVEPDFVSGNVSAGNSTPSGAYRITYKQKNAVLRGQGYASPVSFWMPFNGGIGLHDASWRSRFGGTIYKTSGSHGCINLPYSAAKAIYNSISSGDPVLVYTLAGTENTSVTAQAADNSSANAVVDAINSIGTVTLDSSAAISNARSLYDALSESDRAYVTNYSTLQAAYAAYAALVAQQQAEAAAAAEAAAQEAARQEAQSQAQTVVTAIDAIGTVTLDSSSAISSARSQYDALSDTAKEYVTNYSTLTAAESTLAALQAEQAAQQEQQQQQQEQQGEQQTQQ